MRIDCSQLTICADDSLTQSSKESMHPIFKIALQNRHAIALINAADDSLVQAFASHLQSGCPHGKHRLGSMPRKPRNCTLQSNAPCRDTSNC